MSSFKNHSPSVGIIANVLTPAHRDLVTNALGRSSGGFFTPLDFVFSAADGREIGGEVVLLDLLTDAAGTKEGIRRGQLYLKSVVAYFVSRGIKTIVFAAATKRLPGRSGREFKEKYPDLVFTIGDNGTILSFLRLVGALFGSAVASTDKIVVMGAGFLGEAVIRQLLSYGCRQLVVFSSQHLALPAAVRLTDDFAAIGNSVKLFISCTHLHRDRLDPQAFKSLLSEQAVIVDVAVPPGVGARLMNALPPTVRRFSAGDFFLPTLKYDFSPDILQFPAVGFWYGCFTEAIMLGLAGQDGTNLAGRDFFQVNQANMDLVNEQLELNRAVVQIPFFDLLNETPGHSMVPY
ncbi:MAG: hypothetical protein WC453_03395 [Patescibacteria group bacterium]